MKNAINPNTGSAPTWWIPSADEWYKAAYYDPTLNSGSGGYWNFPMQSNSVPGNVVGASPNQANFNNGVYSVTQNSSYDVNQNYLTNVGAFSGSASYYGTFDQGGNVWEWNDAISGTSRGFRGGSWNSYGYSGANLQSNDSNSTTPSNEYSVLGFRVATVPEPSTVMLMLLEGGAYWIIRRRKNTP